MHVLAVGCENPWYETPHHVYRQKYSVPKFHTYVHTYADRYTPNPSADAFSDRVNKHDTPAPASPSRSSTGLGVAQVPDQALRQTAWGGASSHKRRLGGRYRDGPERDQAPEGSTTTLTANVGGGEAEAHVRGLDHDVDQVRTDTLCYQPLLARRSGRRHRGDGLGPAGAIQGDCLCGSPGAGADRLESGGKDEKRTSLSWLWRHAKPLRRQLPSQKVSVFPMSRPGGIGRRRAVSVSTNRAPRRRLPHASHTPVSPTQTYL